MDQKPWGRLVAATALDDPERATSHRGAVRAASRRSSSACSGEKSRSLRYPAADASRASTRIGGTGSGPVGHAKQGGQRGETDELGLGQLDAVLRGELPDRVPDQPHRRHAEVEQVHRDLGASELGDPEARGLHLREATTGLADTPSDALRELEVVRVEVDVVGDEERPGRHRKRPERRMGAGRAEIGLAPAGPDLIAESLVLPAAYVGQAHPVRAASGVGIEEDGDVVALRDALGETVREFDAVVHRRVTERHDRHDVDRPDSRVLTLVRVQIDERDRLGDQPVQGDEHRLMLARQREDRAVVAGVARPVKEIHAVDRFEGSRQPVNDLEPAALGHVRDGLDEHPSMLAPRPTREGANGAFDRLGATCRRRRPRSGRSRPRA